MCCIGSINLDVAKMSKDRLLDEEDHKSFHAKLQMNCQVDVRDWHRRNQNGGVGHGNRNFLITQRQLPVIKTYKEIRYSIHCNSCVFKLIFMPIIFTNDTIIIV